VVTGRTQMDIVAQLNAPHHLGVVGWVGADVPLHASAAGKLLLAELSPAELEAWIAETRPKRLASRTLTGARELCAELVRVRRRGWAQIVDELTKSAIGTSQIPQQQGQQDFLRLQALMENIANVVSGGIVPSSIGQTGSFSNRGSGILGSLLGGGSKSFWPLIPVIMLLIMVNIRKALGERIREIRKKKNLTQEELAYRSELDYSYINQIENGKRNPSMKAVERIAQALGVKVKELISF